MSAKKLIPAWIAATLSLAAATSQAEGLTLLPVLKPGFKAEPTLALTAGYINPRATAAGNLSSLGLELNFNCLLLQTDDKRIRTHLSYSHASDNGLKADSIELSPRYTVPVSGGLSVGFGPVLAHVRMKDNGAKTSLTGYGLASGLNYRSGMLYAGTDLRYLHTNMRNDATFKNWMVSAKVGVNF